MRLGKGLAVVSFQSVNYTKRQLGCSLNVILQFDKYYLGNMTGMTFSSNILPRADVKALFILYCFLTSSFCLSTEADIHTQAVLTVLSLINHPRCASSLFLACTHTKTRSFKVSHIALQHLVSLPWQPFQK